ncbi:MAG TPA: hypothetical protein VM942_04985 [Acidimicrobiales bacterium]|nr:hypothetical protein [Acidimicrobiales bacterium]
MAIPPPDRLVPWLLRGLWVALPFTVGPALAEALHAGSDPVRTVASLGLWAGWAVGVAASLVPLPLSLTALRLLAPGAVVATVAASAAGSPSALAMVWALVTAAWSFTPGIGGTWVNGPAYPNERRYLLRAPGPLLAGPLLSAWVLAAAGVAAGPLLLAAERWVAGGVAAVVGLPGAWVLVRSMHNLSRRWAVFVPAGMVLHDPLTLLDPVLLQRSTVARLEPAPAGADRQGSGALDLSQRAPGLALEMSLREEASFTVLVPGNREGRPTSTTRFLFTPTRPGAVLDEARRRRLPVG